MLHTNWTSMWAGLIANFSIHNFVFTGSKGFRIQCWQFQFHDEHHNIQNVSIDWRYTQYTTLNLDTDNFYTDTALV